MRLERRQHSKRPRSTQDICSFSFAPISLDIFRVCASTFAQSHDHSVTESGKVLERKFSASVFRVRNHSGKSRFDSIANPPKLNRLMFRGFADDNEEKHLENIDFNSFFFFFLFKRKIKSNFYASYIVDTFISSSLIRTLLFHIIRARAWCYFPNIYNIHKSSKY